MGKMYYPFKYLDSYTRSDKDFYFGRENEVELLYQMVFETDLLLVYGASGTGKTSLIQCGLANKFESYDWLDISIRRMGDINQSLLNTLSRTLGDYEGYQDTEEPTHTLSSKSEISIAKQLQLIHLKYFKPIYLIFDQFEELFILGNKDEQKKFYQTIKEIISLGQRLKIIIVIREEYLGYLYEFERLFPQILNKKIRLEPMSFDKVSQVLTGVNNAPNSLVRLEKGCEQELIERIFNKLRDNRITIELPYFQVLLDKLYLAITNDETHKTEAVLDLNGVQNQGDIGDILFSLLDGLVLKLKKEQGIKPTVTWEILSAFVTVDGTKEPLSIANLQEYFSKISDNEIQNVLQFFVSKRIFRYIQDKDIYEISHDALARQIHANRSVEELAQLQIKKLIRNVVELKVEGGLRNGFTEEQLITIDKFIDNINISQEEKEWIEESRRKIEKGKNKRKKLLRGMFISLIITILALITLIFIYFEADKAKTKAIHAEKEATLAKEEAIKSKNEALFQKEIAEKELNRRMLLEFNDYEKRANNIKNAGGNPGDILIKMDKIAKTHPDSISLLNIVKKYY